MGSWRYPAFCQRERSGAIYQWPCLEHTKRPFNQPCDFSLTKGRKKRKAGIHEEGKAGIHVNGGKGWGGGEASRGFKKQEIARDYRLNVFIENRFASRYFRTYVESGI